MELTVTADGTCSLGEILSIHRAAFGQRTEADLVRNLLADPTAQPCLSITAQNGAQPIGHVLFTRVTLGADKTGPNAAILCPLAVLPDFQNRGAGRALVQDGLQRLRIDKIDLVFVFGDPAYYGRFGFTEADFDRFPTPQPIPDHFRAGWMVQSLTDDPAETWQGQLTCADALDKPHYWST